MKSKEYSQTLSTLEKVLTEVVAERVRQDAKWGEQNHTPEWWMLILTEEVGEAAQAALESNFGKQRDERERWTEHYRKEMVQVAAVAVAAIEAFDRGNTYDQ